MNTKKTQQKRTLDNRENDDPRFSESEKRETGPTGKRVPLGAPMQKLTVNDFGESLNNYSLRWVNDEGDRLMRAQQGGYTFVDKGAISSGIESPTENTEAYVKCPVGGKSNGEPLFAYLMKIEKEFYESDQSEKMAAVDRIDEAIHQGRAGNTDPSRYVKTAQYQINSKI